MEGVREAAKEARRSKGRKSGREGRNCLQAESRKINCIFSGMVVRRRVFEVDSHNPEYSACAW